MRKIEFIEPVKSLRGNLSGSQKLTYPTNDNSAWDAPEGKKSYATNYTPKYIGAKRSKDGKCYFATKQRSAVNLTSDQKFAMALFGASVSLEAAMEMTPAVLAAMQSAYSIAHSSKSFTKWAQGEVRRYLKAYSDFVFVGNTVVFVKNPFLSNHAAGALDFIIEDKDVIIKFWGQLSLNGMYYSVDDEKCICFIGNTFAQIIANPILNTLGFQSETISGVNYLKAGSSLYITDDNDEYIQTSKSPQPGQELTTTVVAPE